MIVIANNKERVLDITIRVADEVDIVKLEQGLGLR